MSNRTPTPNATTVVTMLQNLTGMVTSMVRDQQPHTGPSDIILSKFNKLNIQKRHFINCVVVIYLR
jgi:hypothetical protein